ncbi:MAG: DUF3465 domain-containing protein [Nitrosomonadales bacterium]|nr:DUF3465 domain-containing protein [Nitrosomonadales bacterium]
MKHWLIALAIVLAYVGYGQYDSGQSNAEESRTPVADVTESISNDQLLKAFEQQNSNLLVEGRGVVTQVLADDNKGSRHQRFILQVNSQQTVLIAHNIDLAPRIARLAPGDIVAFSGQYEWNPKGGVVHWTHHDPQGSHPGGWLRHQGKTYQ